MKRLLLVLTPVLFLSFSVSAQRDINPVCDSIWIDALSVNQASHSLEVSLYNSSHTWWAYPMLEIFITPNPYLTASPLQAVSSVMDSVNGPNGGFTLFFNSLDSFTAASSVPLNTVFTVTAILTDPNDSTVDCDYGFTFTYGTMSTGIEKTNSLQSAYVTYEGNDAVLYLTTERSGELSVSLLDIDGKLLSMVSSFQIQSGENKISIPAVNLLAGIYFLQLNQEGARSVIKFVRTE